MYDLIIVGAGPGGYVAAERAGQKGKKVLLVEREELGGVCLNWGCIPTKTLLNSAKVFYATKHGENFGVEVESAHFRLEKAMQRKAEVQAKLRAGIAGLMKRFKVEVVRGDAELVSATSITVGGDTYEGKHIIVATGSRPAKPPIPGADAAHVLDSTGILDIETLPTNLVIVGGGVIGLEFACFFASVGVNVTVLEMLPQIGGPIDPELANTLSASLQKKGTQFHLGARVTRISDSQVAFQDADGQEQQIDADMVLLSTGRLPNVENLGLEAVGVDVSKRGISIDERCRTNVPTISAIGDCTGKIMLAHVASRQGEVVINTLYGAGDHMRYGAVPGVIYTSPEVAFCGMTEAEAADKGIATQVAKWPLQANGRFIAETDEKGLAKVVVDAETRAILGVHIVGHACSEMIHAAALAIENELRVDEFKETIFPHPTVSEAVRDALFHV